MEKNRMSYVLMALAPCLVMSFMLFTSDAKGLLVTGGVFAAALLYYLIVRFRFMLLAAAIAVMAFCPFYFGIQAGGLPKIYADNIIYFTYIIYFFILYVIIRQKRPYLGDAPLAMALGLFFLAHAISFVFNPTASIPARNFFETYFLGIILLYIFLIEVEQKNIDLIINVIVFTTFVLSVLVIAEKVAGYNPIMDAAPKDFSYITPEQAAQVRGVYRPYATFFSPSEAGTFIAMGIPFIVYRMYSFRWPLAVVLLGASSAAIVLNYTRGVWIALALTGLIFIRRLRLIAAVLAPAAVLGGTVLAMTMRDNPFVQRLFDPANLLNRFFYWDIALNIFGDNMLMGIGHMKFKDMYLKFVRGVDATVSVDIKQVFVPDNIFLTTLIEHGLFGFIALTGLIVFVFLRLRSLRTGLAQAGDTANENLVKACGMGLSIYILAGLLADVHLFTKATKFCFIIMGVAFSVAKGRHFLYGGASRAVKKRASEGCDVKKEACAIKELPL